MGRLLFLSGAAEHPHQIPQVHGQKGFAHRLPLFAALFGHKGLEPVGVCGGQPLPREHHRGLLVLEEIEIGFVLHQAVNLFIRNFEAVFHLDAGLIQPAFDGAGLASPAWTKEVTILNADSVSTWDLRGLFERMAQSPYIKKQYQNAILESQLVEFQLLTNQIVEEKHTQAPSSTNALIAQAVAYLQENYTNPDLTVADLATYTYTSREYLSRSFKKYTMESIHGYLTNLRMQHCRRAIAAGTSILDACTESGFSNYSSFLKTFRRLYGMTPADYRNQLNELCGKYQLDLLEQTKTLSASAQQ